VSYFSYKISYGTECLTTVQKTVREDFISQLILYKKSIEK